MKIIDTLGELPNSWFRQVESKEVLPDCDYAFFHPTLKFYSCFYYLTDKERNDIIR